MRGAAIESSWSFNARALHRHFLLLFFYVHFRQWLVGLIGSALSGKLALIFLGFVHSEGEEWRGFFFIIISLWIN